MPDTQQTALRGIPRDDMLVDPGRLEAVLQDPRLDTSVSIPVLIAATVAAVAPTIIAALWWATSHT